MIDFAQLIFYNRNMSKKEFEQLEKIETLLADFLNRAGDPDEQLISDALDQVIQLVESTRSQQKELESRLQLLNEARRAANPDRMGGQFTADEILNSSQWR